MSKNDFKVNKQNFSDMTTSDDSDTLLTRKHKRFYLDSNIKNE